MKENLKKLLKRIGKELNIKEEELIILWLTEKIFDVVEDEQQAYEEIKLASKELKNQTKK